jgi:hypothetical protein
MEAMKDVYKKLVVSLKERDYLEDLDIYGRII